MTTINYLEKKDVILETTCHLIFHKIYSFSNLKIKLEIRWCYFGLWNSITDLFFLCPVIRSFMIGGQFWPCRPSLGCGVLCYLREHLVADWETSVFQLVNVLSPSLRGSFQKSEHPESQLRAAEAATALEHLCNLDFMSEPTVPKMSGIICTIGELRGPGGATCRSSDTLYQECSLLWW